MAAGWPVNKWKAQRFSKWKWIILIALNLNIKGSKALERALFGVDSADVFLKYLSASNYTGKWNSATGIVCGRFCTWGWVTGGSQPKRAGVKTTQGLPLSEWTNLCPNLLTWTTRRDLALWSAPLLGWNGWAVGEDLLCQQSPNFSLWARTGDCYFPLLGDRCLPFHEGALGQLRLWPKGITAASHFWVLSPSKSCTQHSGQARLSYPHTPWWNT